MKGALSTILIIIPELAIFVFIGVCASMVMIKGGPVKSLIPLVFTLAVNLHALNKALRRKP